MTPFHTPHSLDQVKIPTEIYDEMGPVDEDPRWQIMGEFHQCELFFSRHIIEYVLIS